MILQCAGSDYSYVTFSSSTFLKCICTSKFSSLKVFSTNIVKVLSESPLYDFNFKVSGPYHRTVTTRNSFHLQQFWINSEIIPPRITYYSLKLQENIIYFLCFLDNGAFHFCTFFYFNFVIQPKIDFSTNIYYIKDEFIIFYYQHTEYSTLKNRFLQYLEDRGSRIHDVKNHVLITIIYLFIWLTLAFIVTYFTLLNLQIFSVQKN